jgi:hypothetical protein
MGKRDPGPQARNQGLALGAIAQTAALAIGKEF